MSSLPFDIPEDMNDAELLEWMGTDALHWAQAFCMTAARLELSMKSEDFLGWVLGWFANAIQAGAASNR